MIADLSTATAATINQLRQSFQIQKLLEREHAICGNGLCALWSPLSRCSTSTT